MGESGAIDQFLIDGWCKMFCIGKDGKCVFGQLLRRFVWAKWSLLRRLSMNKLMCPILTGPRLFVWFFSLVCVLSRRGLVSVLIWFGWRTSTKVVIIAAWASQALWSRFQEVLANWLAPPGWLQLALQTPHPPSYSWLGSAAKFAILTIAFGWQLVLFSFLRVIIGTQ